MQLFEQKFKQYLREEESKVSKVDAVEEAYGFYKKLLSIDKDENKVLTYLNKVTESPKDYEKFSMEDHIDAFKDFDASLEEKLSKTQRNILIGMAALLLGGSLSPIGDYFDDNPAEKPQIEMAQKGGGGDDGGNSPDEDTNKIPLGNDYEETKNSVIDYLEKGNEIKDGTDPAKLVGGLTYEVDGDEKYAFQISGDSGMSFVLLLDGPTNDLDSDAELSKYRGLRQLKIDLDKNGVKYSDIDRDVAKKSKDVSPSDNTDKDSVKTNKSSGDSNSSNDKDSSDSSDDSDTTDTPKLKTGNETLYYLYADGIADIIEIEYEDFEPSTYKIYKHSDSGGKLKLIDGGTLSNSDMDGLTKGYYSPNNGSSYLQDFKVSEDGTKLGVFMKYMNGAGKNLSSWKIKK